MITLELPLPPSRNRASGKTARATHYKKRAYQKLCWGAAIRQTLPTLDPPEHVIVRAHFRLYGELRDGDGLDLKWVLDALQQRQRGSLAWRQGVHPLSGYYVEDDPKHLTHGGVPTQETDRLNIGLTITIEEFHGA